MNLFFIISGPVLILLGTYLIWYFDKKRIKADPLIGLKRIASQILPNYPRNEIIRHDKLYVPANRRIDRVIFIGWTMIIIGTIITIIGALQ